MNFVLAAILMAIMLLFTRELILSKTQQEPGTSIKLERRSITKKRSLEEYAVIIRDNLFDLPEKNLYCLDRPAQVYSSVIPENSISLPVLSGVITGPRKFSCAVIADTSGRQMAFRPGEPVFGNGILQSVTGQNAVIRTARGNLIKLELVNLKTSSSPAALPERGLGAGRAQEKEFLLDKRRVMALLEKPSAFMTDARVIAGGEGRQNGFIIKDIRAGGLYDYLGLINGDVLLCINGSELHQADQLLQALSALKGADKVNLDILRAGEKITLNYLMN